MKTRDLIKLLISLLIISTIVAFLATRGYFSILQKMDFTHWLWILVLSLATFLVNGVQEFTLVRHISGTRLRTGDVLFMPMSMNLFSYFIPTNGGIIYAIYFLKKKYKVDTRQGFSVGVVTIYISFIISGLATLIALFFFGSLMLWLVLLALMMIFSPLLVYLGDVVLQLIPFRKGSLFNKAQVYLHEVIRQSLQMLRNLKITLINAALTVFALLIIFGIYYLLNDALDTHMTLLSLIAIITMQRISVLIRLLPGNLGLEELMTAALFGIIGQDPSIGLLYSVFMRFCTFVWTLPVGVLHTMFNASYFSVNDVKALLRKKDNERLPE